MLLRGCRCKAATAGLTLTRGCCSSVLCSVVLPLVALLAVHRIKAAKAGLTLTHGRCSSVLSSVVLLLVTLLAVHRIHAVEGLPRLLVVSIQHLLANHFILPAQYVVILNQIVKKQNKMEEIISTMIMKQLCG
jgi:hypothetical protein